MTKGKEKLITYKILAQIVGIILIIVCVIAPQRKTRDGILLFSLFGNVLWALQFLLLGDIGGVLTGCVTIVRTGIFYIYARNSKKAPIWIMALLAIVMIGVNILKWRSWASILLMLGVVNIYGQWQEKKTVMRGALAWTTVFNGIYCVLMGAYTGAVNEFMQTASAGAALWRFREKKVINDE